MDIVERCYDYLSNGGLSNPELMDHEAVSNLVIDCRNEIERLRQQNAELVKEINKLKQAKEVNKYDHHYPDDGFGGRPMQYDYNRR